MRLVNATNTTVGGTTSAARNVISANGEDGVQLANPGTTGNVVEGNFIGTNADRHQSLANHRDGVYLNAGAGGNTIGGTATGAGNVISGNACYGVIIDGSSHNTVAGDRIGTDPTGTLALPNHYDGVHIVNQSAGNTIGGTTAAARNVISGNGEDGVQIDFAGASGNLVEGNYIGTDTTGTAALGNGRDGVYLYSGATGNTIGGTPPAGERDLGQRRATTA